MGDSDHSAVVGMAVHGFVYYALLAYILKKFIFLMGSG